LGSSTKTETDFPFTLSCVPGISDLAVRAALQSDHVGAEPVSGQLRASDLRIQLKRIGILADPASPAPLAAPALARICRSLAPAQRAYVPKELEAEATRHSACNAAITMRSGFAMTSICTLRASPS
jgi:hypothetical protein